jgi:hypothetical protein
MDEVKHLLQGLSIPAPPLAADEPLLQSLHLDKPTQSVSTPQPPSTSQPASTSLPVAIADDPDVVIVNKVEKTPSDCKYVMMSQFNFPAKV